MPTIATIDYQRVQQNGSVKCRVRFVDGDYSSTVRFQVDSQSEVATTITRKQTEAESLFKQQEVDLALQYSLDGNHPKDFPWSQNTMAAGLLSLLDKFMGMTPEALKSFAPVAATFTFAGAKALTGLPDAKCQAIADWAAKLGSAVQVVDEMRTLERALQNG